jgi:acyl-CoA thioester hydrolase
MSYLYKHRVRYADTDQMGVVYHGRYFEWFEAARTEMIRSRGLSYQEVEKSGIMMPVIEAGCRYSVPVRYDELVGIRVTIRELTRAKIRMEYEVIDEKKNIRAEGFTLHCFLKEGRPVRIPESLDRILRKSD